MGPQELDEHELDQLRRRDARPREIPGLLVDKAFQQPLQVGRLRRSRLHMDQRRQGPGEKPPAFRVQQDMPAESKTANILFALALDERTRAHGVRAFSLHPGGIVDTGLGKHLSLAELQAAGVLDGNGRPVLDPSRNLKTVEQGAATSVWCATRPQLDGMGGVYCQNSDIAPLVSGQAVAREVGSMALGVRPHAVDPLAADRLWSLSERLPGLEPFDADERHGTPVACPE
jgi:hypothetical protein